MRRLPIIAPYSSYATAVTIKAGELHLEPVRILDDRWCIRRNGRLIPVEPGDFDAFVLSGRSVDDGVGLWENLASYLADRRVVAIGGRKALAAALKAGHWGPYRCRLGSVEDADSDSGVEATLGRGAMRRAA